MTATDLPRVTYEPKQWAAITAQQNGPWDANAWFAAASYCERARANENPVPPIWDLEMWWEFAEEALCNEIEQAFA